MNKIDDFKRDLIISGAFYEVGNIVNYYNMKDWKEKPNDDKSVLSQVASPYLPSVFFDEFADREPTEKELLCANLQNFIENIALIRKELENKYFSNYKSNLAIFSVEKLNLIKETMNDELTKIKLELKYDKLNKEDTIIDEVKKLISRKNDLKWFLVDKEEYDDFQSSSWVLDKKDGEMYILGYSCDRPLEYSEEFFNFNDRYEVSKMLLEKAEISIEEAIEIANQNYNYNMEIQGNDLLER